MTLAHDHHRTTLPSGRDPIARRRWWALACVLSLAGAVSAADATSASALTPSGFDRRLLGTWSLAVGTITFGADGEWSMRGDVRDVGGPASTTAAAVITLQEADPRAAVDHLRYRFLADGALLLTDDDGHGHRARRLPPPGTAAAGAGTGAGATAVQARASASASTLATSPPGR